jgi:hypothetical protein
MRVGRSGNTNSQSSAAAGAILDATSLVGAAATLLDAADLAGAVTMASTSTGQKAVHRFIPHLSGRPRMMNVKKLAL